MQSLISRLFADSEIAHIESLLRDDNPSTINREIGKKLLESNEIITSNAFEQLLMIVSVCQFADNEECHSIAKIIDWGIHEPNILPSVVDQYNQPKELAYKCLISLSFFKNAIIQKYERHGAPNPNFYRGIGITSFKRVGMNQISAHFQQWESFLNEMFY